MIVSVVLEKPLGEVNEGTVLQVEQDIAQGLIAAGVAREATEEDLGGEENVEAEEAGEGEGDAAPSLPEMASVARNIEATVTKATERAVERLAGKALRPPLNAHVAGSDHARTGGYKSLGDAIQGMYSAQKGDSTSAKKYNAFRSAHTKATGMSIGGSHVGSDLVPQEWASELWRLSFKDVPDLLGMCQKYEMKHQVENIPAWVQASGASGVQSNVIAEANAITATVGTTATVQLQLVKAAVLVNTSDELRRFNAYNLDATLKAIVPERIRFLTNGSIIAGTNSQVGLINNAATVTVTRATANQINFSDVLRMRASLWESFRSGACWFTSPDTTPALYSMAFPNNGASTQFPVFVPGGGFGNSAEAEPLGKLLGLPVYEVENCPALGTKGDIILAHMPSIAAGYSGLIADETPYLYFDLAQDSFRFLWYFDTVNPLTTPYTRASGGTASNLVVLSTAASSSSSS